MECSATRAGWLPFTGSLGAASLCAALFWAVALPGRLPADDPPAAQPAAAQPAARPAAAPAKQADDKPAGEDQVPAQPADESAGEADVDDEAASADGPRTKIVPLRMAAGHAVPVRADLDQTFQDRVDGLIRQLGDSSYTVRQRASKQLIEIGIAGQPLLSEALADEDAEVRNRSAQVLTKVVEADFLARLEAFANDPLGKQEQRCPAGVASARRSARRSPPATCSSRCSGPSRPCLTPWKPIREPPASCSCCGCSRSCKPSNGRNSTAATRWPCRWARFVPCSSSARPTARSSATRTRSSSTT